MAGSTQQHARGSLCGWATPCSRDARPDAIISAAELEIGLWVSMSGTHDAESAAGLSVLARRRDGNGIMTPRRANNAIGYELQQRLRTCSSSSSSSTAQEAYIAVACCYADDHLTCTITHYTHPFNGPFSGTTRVNRHQKGKTNLDFTEARDSEWQWHQLGHMQVCTSLQTDNHTSIPPLSFYRPDALPAAQPTASKH